VLECFRDIQAKALRWVWAYRYPAGKVCLLAGNPNMGKSLITVDMAARITNGRPFPDGAPCERGEVIILSAEDDAEDTIRPRLDAAGADVSRVYLLSAVVVPKEVKPRVGIRRNGEQQPGIIEREFSLDSDIKALADAIKQHPDTKMIVIDPISAYLGGTDSNNNAEVRRLLTPLTKLAARTGVLILGVTHMRKSVGQAIHRPIESIAFMAAGRAAWGVGYDPEDANKRVMVCIKSNLAPDIGGLAYRIEDTHSGSPRIAWEPGTVNIPADDVLGGLDSREEGSARHEAAKWLREYLADGPKPATEVKERATAAGFSWATLRRAKATLNVSSTQDTFHGPWMWSLPSCQGITPGPGVGTDQERAQLVPDDAGEESV
jgi:archaellum biogenesis ATPase FlaH